MISEAPQRIPAGTEIPLEPPVKATIDGRVHDAAPFTKDGAMCFVIILEVGIPGLFTKLLATKKLTLVI